MTHIVELNELNVGDWQFKKEIKELREKIQGSTQTRPIIITVQIGETRWVWSN